MRKGRPPRYGPGVVEVLWRIWKVAEQPCGKRLKALLPEWLPHYQREHGGLAAGVRPGAEPVDEPVDADRCGAVALVALGRRAQASVAEARGHRAAHAPLSGFGHVLVPEVISSGPEDKPDLLVANVFEGHRVGVAPDTRPGLLASEVFRGETGVSIQLTDQFLRALIMASAMW